MSHTPPSPSFLRYAYSINALAGESCTTQCKKEGGAFPKKILLLLPTDKLGACEQLQVSVFSFVRAESRVCRQQRQRYLSIELYI